MPLLNLYQILGRGRTVRGGRGRRLGAGARIRLAGNRCPVYQRKSGTRAVRQSSWQ